jgi:hypothetical protein
MDKKRLSFKLTFVSTATSGGHTEYTVRVLSSTDKTFHIKDRFKSMRTLCKTIKINMPNQSNLVPDFPPKKWFGNSTSEFVMQRRGELENFFNTLLENELFAKSKIILGYFFEHA